MEEMSGALARLKARKRPILELLKEKQARQDAYQQALDAGDYAGESELGSTRAERRAQQEMGEEGMNEGGVGGDTNLTQKILNFLRKKKLTPVGRERGSPVSQKRPGVPSPLPQPLSEEEDLLRSNI